MRFFVRGINAPNPVVVDGVTDKVVAICDDCYWADRITALLNANLG